MPNVPAVATAFGDLLDPRFQEIFDDDLPQIDNMLPELFTFVGSNGREDIRWSEVGAFADWSQFTGSVTYQSNSQGFDTVLTPLEFASGFQVERRLFDDDQYHIMDQRPSGLATAYQRTRQGHGARMFNNGFSVDTFFYVNSEAVPVFSNSHTTNSGASTSAGFDNLITNAFSATALASARIQAKGFRDDNANRFAVKLDEIWYPPNLYETVFEVVESMGKVQTANNNRNVHHGAYTMKEWDYLNDANNWFAADSTLRKRMVFWEDRIPVEFAFAEDLDTIIAKWRGYARYGNAHVNWRFGIGASVS